MRDSALRRFETTNWIAHLPWAHSDPLQSFFWFPSTFKIFNNLGNLLFAKRQPKSAQREGFCHGFATVVHEPNRLALKVQTVSGYLLPTQSYQQKLAVLICRFSL